MSDLVLSSWGIAALVTFVLAYGFVIAEEKIHLRKSKPVMLAAGLIWIFAAVSFQQKGLGGEIEPRLRLVLSEYAELFLFLLSAITFVNTMVERKVFEALSSHLLSKGLSPRGIFWATGLGTFFLSPMLDNLTTALVMGTVVVSALGVNKKAVPAALLNIVIAANAGGTFTPFGDITTLMIWQKGVLKFGDFFVLFIPALINWIIPAAIISLSMPRETGTAKGGKTNVLKGGYAVVGLFFLTIVLTISMDHFLGLPPFLGMTFGLGALSAYGYFLKGSEMRTLTERPAVPTVPLGNNGNKDTPFEVYRMLEKVEWDTLLFFYGIMMCIGGLGALGYLDALSKLLYAGLGPTDANVSIGILSAIIDNIPLTYGVLSMNPPMGDGEWLLLALTAGVGGSILSIGSAAGVALMGVKGSGYTFMSHFKWTWAVLLGYAASIVTHLWLNQDLFTR